MARRIHVPPSSETRPASSTLDDVARRAYELYQARGGEPGAELDDWLRAERELRDATESDTLS
jgi:hypothetical protein